MYQAALARLEQMGGTRVEIDFSIFRAVAELLYSGPWVAERLAAIQPFFESQCRGDEPGGGGIIVGGARQYSAVDTFEAEYRLRAYRRDLPSASGRAWMCWWCRPRPPFTRMKQIASRPGAAQHQSGLLHEFRQPDGSGSSGDAGGIPLATVSPSALLLSARRLAMKRCWVWRTASIATTPKRPGPAIDAGRCPPGCVAVAVVGAHLSGQPLNRQLTDRRARLLKTTKTLPATGFTRCRERNRRSLGLVREEGFEGPGIEVEVWAVPENEFGSFVAGVPAPLGIGNATLEDGEIVKCFICEPYGLRDALEITQFGGWRAFLASQALRARV